MRHALHIAQDERGNFRMVVSDGGKVVMDEIMTPPVVENISERFALTLEALASALRGRGRK